GGDARPRRCTQRAGGRTGVAPPGRSGAPQHRVDDRRAARATQCRGPSAEGRGGRARATHRRSPPRAPRDPYAGSGARGGGTRASSAALAQLVADAAAGAERLSASLAAAAALLAPGDTPAHDAPAA